MREMVLRGPSQYDCVLIYENLAIDYLDEARNRWSELHVDYPEPNTWNELPITFSTFPGATRGSEPRRPSFSSFS
jgi:hypothetical protein